MARIDLLLLRCRNPEAQQEFYRDVLGMNCFGDGTLGYGHEEARLRFLAAESRYTPNPDDLYWKIALAVPNIELACEQLTAKGIQAGPPRQFRDVGFLAHFTDPEGFTIELIEHWFQGNRRKEPTFEPDLLGGGAHLNLLTLRTAGIQLVLDTCKGWGMKLLCVQPVEPHGFTLYFFAFTQDTSPDPDVYSVANREWVYQRRYTILEVQHVHDAVSIRTPAATHAGYAGAVFSGVQDSIGENDLMISARA